jgi:HD-GYP domain-containing protein (c-di-GMP phosphodiesterase class II)
VGGGFWASSAALSVTGWRPGRAWALVALSLLLTCQHTLVGERILAVAPALTAVARLVRLSHERWDGSGHPDGLAGEEIPVGARIIAVCDTYDAITSKRGYADARSHEAPLAELGRCSRTQFDARVVRAFSAANPVRLEHPSPSSI